MIDEICRIHSWNYPDQNSPQRHFFFQYDAQEVTGGKPKTVRDIAQEIIKVLHDLAYGKQPDYNFEESQQRCVVFISLRNEDQAEGSDANIHDPGKKDQQRKDPPGKKIGVV